MNKFIILTLLSSILCLGQIDCVLNPKVVCYYDYWFVWHTGNDKMTVDDIDSSLCTHIVYSTLDIQWDGEISFRGDDYLLVEQKDLLRFSQNKGKAKAMVDLLGTNLASIAHDATRRSSFAHNLVQFFKKYDFDGVVLNGVQDINSNDLVDLLKIFPNLFGDQYVLGINVGSQPNTFKANLINQYVDFISVQTYDYHGKWETAGSDHHMVVDNGAPLDLQLKSLSAWENAGAQANKLLMSIPLFGHTWYLADGKDSKPGARAIKAGANDGIISYKELCSEMMAEVGSWEVHNIPAQAVIYAVNKENNMWVSFESSITTEAKTNTATSLGYGGVVAVRLENDDYRGLCGQKYGLLRGINKGLNTEDVTRAPHTITTRTPPTVTPDPSKVCQKTGTVRDPKDCNLYHRCTEVMPGIISDDVEHCAKGEAFDPKDSQCKDKSLVPGC